MPVALVAVNAGGIGLRSALVEPPPAANATPAPATTTAPAAMKGTGDFLWGRLAAAGATASRRATSKASRAALDSRSGGIRIWGLRRRSEPP